VTGSENVTTIGACSHIAAEPDAGVVDRIVGGVVSPPLPPSSPPHAAAAHTHTSLAIALNLIMPPGSCNRDATLMFPMFAGETSVIRGLPEPDRGVGRHAYDHRPVLDDGIGWQPAQRVGGVT
jgi:hypothetical protein